MKKSTEINGLEFEITERFVKLKAKRLKITLDFSDDKSEPISKINKKDRRRNHKWFSLVRKALWPIMQVIIAGLILKFIEKIIFPQPDIAIYYTVYYTVYSAIVFLVRR